MRRVGVSQEQYARLESEEGLMEAVDAIERTLLRYFAPDQDAHSGGSGCGCSASVLNGWLLGRMMDGEIRRMLFMATGALLSPTTVLQGETIPGIAHAVLLEKGVV